MHAQLSNSQLDDEEDGTEFRRQSDYEDSNVEVEPHMLAHANDSLCNDSREGGNAYEDYKASNL